MKFKQTSAVYSLYPKKPSINTRIQSFLNKYAWVFLILCMIILAVLIVILLYALMGVGAVESGVYYNGFESLI